MDPCCLHMTGNAESETGCNVWTRKCSLFIFSDCAWFIVIQADHRTASFLLYASGLFSDQSLPEFRIFPFCIRLRCNRNHGFAFHSRTRDLHQDLHKVCHTVIVRIMVRFHLYAESHVFAHCIVKPGITDAAVLNHRLQDPVFHAKKRGFLFLFFCKAQSAEQTQDQN